MKSKWLGTEVKYNRGLKLQEKLVNLCRSKRVAIVLGLEHQSVVTLGRRAQVAAEIGDSLESLNALGFQILKTSRGGLATMHAPGQLVIYPILPLRHFGFGVRAYMEALMKSTVVCLRSMDIESVVRNAGVYTAGGKIAFFGVRVVRGVAMHGLSINVHNDLNVFHLIRSCGNQLESFDSLQSLKIQLSTHEVFLRWTQHFIHLTHQSLYPLTSPTAHRTQQLDQGHTR